MEQLHSKNAIQTMYVNLVTSKLDITNLKVVLAFFYYYFHATYEYVWAARKFY